MIIRKRVFRLFSLWPITAGLVLFSMQGQSATTAAGFLDMITDAQSRLTSVEQRVSRERQTLARQLNTLEREVHELREKTAVARRLSDEKTLSLSQLENRLESWQQQQVYQNNLLHRFLQQHGESGSFMNSSEQIAEIVRFSGRLGDFFFPRWQESKVTLPGGQISVLPTLSVGPIFWYWDEDSERAGIASLRDDGRLQGAATLARGDSEVISALRTQTVGELIFDPTLGRALARQQHSETVVEHLVKGGLWVVPILFFAVFALSIALVKSVQFWRLPKLVRFTPAAVESVLLDGNTTVTGRAKGMQKWLLDIALSAKSTRQRDDHLFMQLQEDRHALDRWISAIAITAAVSPLLGLLGTVSGMIETFKMMTLFGSGDPEVVSGGIAQALVTTELGLVVAIPALILNAILSRKAKSYYNGLESFAILISKVEESAQDSERKPK